MIFNRSIVNAVSAAAFAALILATGLSGCGGKREVPPDEMDVPTTLPREQVLFRQAKDALTKWLSIFDDDGNFNAAYPMLTWKSRQELKELGITNAADFGGWFERRREAGDPPFSYTFSRIDVLEIDLSDTTRAAITGTFVVEVKEQEFESVGIFYLRREHNTWKVPFADSEGFVRGWWKKEQDFDVAVKEAGISTYASGEYGVEFKYPVAWDIEDDVPFSIPYIPESTRGLQVAYRNPSTQELETVVRITELPPTMTDPALAADTSISGLRPIRQEMAGILSEPGFTGRIYWLYNPERQRVLAIYGAVDTTQTAYDLYAESIDDLVRSIEILK